MADTAMCGVAVYVTVASRFGLNNGRDVAFTAHSVLLAMAGKHKPFDELGKNVYLYLLACLLIRLQ